MTPSLSVLRDQAAQAEGLDWPGVGVAFVIGLLICLVVMTVETWRRGR